MEQVAGNVKKAVSEPLNVRGMLGASSVWYSASGIAPRRDPFFWVFNANLTIVLFSKIHVPFTAVITQQDKNFSNGIDRFSQPFNQFGISPRYRWLTVHAGYRSMDFSEHTLSGAIWLGGGIEVKPEKSLWSGAAFFGRFLKAVPKGGVEGVVVSVPAYERWGGGAKLRFGTNADFAHLHFTKITDDPGSIPFDTSVALTPQQNELFGIHARHALAKFVAVEAEMDLSLHRKNLFTDQLAPMPQLTRLLFSDGGEGLSKTIKTGIEFTPTRQTLSLRYKRVDPDYLSLGALFLTNDVEELSFGSSLVSHDNELSGSVAVGLQRNNLDRIQTLTSRRIVGSVDLSWTPVEVLSLSANYSSFSSNSIARRDVFTDSIAFVQLTQSGAFTTNFAFGNGVPQMVIASVSYQETGGSSIVSTFGNASFSYNMTIAQTGWSLNFSGICNSLSTGTTSSMMGIGPQSGVQKVMFKGRFRVAINGGFQDSFFDGAMLARNYTASANISFAVSCNQSLRADGSWLMKDGKAHSVGDFSETRGMLAYSYQFGASKKKAGNNK